MIMRGSSFPAASSGCPQQQCSFLQYDPLACICSIQFAYYDLWFSNLTLALKYSTSFDVIKFLFIFYFLKALFLSSYLVWLDLRFIGMDWEMLVWLVCRALTDEYGSLNVFVLDSFLKAIQIAVSHFLYQELEGIHGHSHTFKFMSLLRSKRCLKKTLLGHHQIAMLQRQK